MTAPRKPKKIPPPPDLASFQPTVTAALEQEIGEGGAASTPSRGHANLDETVAAVFAAKGMLSRSLAGDGRQWEERPEQQEMALAIARSVKEKSHLLVEAGTGVGKSYAYLVPLILWAVENKKRVLIATHTKALQGQLVDKDLPFLRQLFADKLDINFRYALCLGTQNYLCPRRLAKSQALGLFSTGNDIAQQTQIRDWAKTTPTGRNLDLPFEPSAQIWAQLNRESDLCLGRSCPLYEDSFFYKARREQERAQVLVANHHLLFAHLAAGGNDAAAVLPSFHALVIDEAHQAEDVASNYLGLEVSNLGVARLIELLHHRRANRTVLAGAKLGNRSELEEKLIAAAEEARQATGSFFENLQMDLRIDATRSNNQRIREPLNFENNLDEPLARLESVLRAARGDVEKTNNEELTRELEGYESRCGEMREALDELMNHSHSQWVYWCATAPRHNTAQYQTSGARVPRIALHGAPIDVAEALQETLFKQIQPVVLTSATLTTGSNFEFLRERLGLVPELCETPVKTLHLDSPFDFHKNALLYIARDLPDPFNTAMYEAEAMQRAVRIIERTNGRAFVLCTSFRMVEATTKALRNSLTKGIEVLRQGEMERGKLLNEFRADIHSVLVGTTSFWQGVDVPGESLSCVIIMKLPFAVPDDPMVQARVEELKKKGRDAFNEYQVPQAVMMFRQGFGRLIRTATDRGIVAILDPRIATKRYGRTFLESLPDCSVTNDIEAISGFLNANKTES